jgi:hypothetical protein
MTYNAWVKLIYKNRTLTKPFKIIAMSIRHAKEIIKYHIEENHSKTIGYKIEELK